MPTLAKEGLTLFLVTSAGCEPCKTELPSYPDLLRTAHEAGLATRMLVISSSQEENRWFLDRAPQEAALILDSMELGPRGLKALVTPSVVVVNSEGKVAGG